MNKNRPLTALMLASILTWSCGSDAMQTTVTQNILSKKIESTAGSSAEPIKAFTSKKETKNAYEELWMKEQKLLLAKECNVEKDINKKAWQAYCAELMHFYQKLFRLIVIRDIDEQKLYTIILGLSYKTDGTLTMARIPLAHDQLAKHNALLFKLSIYPDDPVLLNELQEYHKPNTAPGQSADQFFPAIVLKSDIDLEITGIYDANQNNILVAPRRFSLAQCTVMLHEFTHARQRCQIGGISQLMNNFYHELPFSIARELDAEFESIRHHPHPKHLLELIEPRYRGILKKGWAEEMAEQSFPYFPPAEKYLRTCAYHKLWGNSELHELAKKTHQVLKQKMPNIIQACIDLSPEEAQKKYPCCSRAMEENYGYEQGLSSRSKKLRELLLKKEKSGTLIERIKKTPSYLRGCKHYFEIKCKALGIEQKEGQGPSIIDDPFDEN
ncbi:MAG: hypothetical protein M1549_01170 [Candidatus Dependentiae bacterium]|nr:hypothetical protein [Candidatus Dependentiae bacterium]